MANTLSPAILSLDTAQEDCAVALYRDGRLLARRVEHVGSRHAERILSMLDEALEEAKLEKREIGLVAFGAGPGSFTGLRVACGVAQGVAWALHVDTAPVSNLEALALDEAEERKLPAGTVVAVMNDARMSELYAGVYRTGAPGERLERLAGPELVKPEGAAEYVRSSGASIVTGSGPSVYPQAFAGIEAALVAVRLRSAPEAIARIGAMLAKEGATVPPEDASPVYVRNRVALTSAERARGERL